MKKYFLLFLVLLAIPVMFAGCKGTTPPPITSPIDVVDVIQDKVCNAPPAVLAVADVVIALLKPELVALVPESAPFVAYITAQNIKTSGCAAATGLNTMIAFAQGYNTKTMLAYKTSKVKGPMPNLIPISPLTAWRDKAKKS